MWEIFKFFLLCLGFCCLISTAALLYMVYGNNPYFITEEPEDGWQINWPK